MYLDLAPISLLALSLLLAAYQLRRVRMRAELMAALKELTASHSELSNRAVALLDTFNKIYTIALTRDGDVAVSSLREIASLCESATFLEIELDLTQTIAGKEQSR